MSWSVGTTNTISDSGNCIQAKIIAAVVLRPISSNTHLSSGEYLVNSGIFMFRVGNMLQELKKYSPDLSCKPLATTALRIHWFIISVSSHWYAICLLLSADCSSVAFKSSRLPISFHSKLQWTAFACNVCSNTDLSIGTASIWFKILSLYKILFLTCFLFLYAYLQACSRSGEYFFRVANGLQDVLIVNTQDAVYVGKKGESGALKDIIRENPQMSVFVENGRMVYRAWGSYELLVDDPSYRVKKIQIHPHIVFAFFAEYLFQAYAAPKIILIGRLELHIRLHTG